MQEQNLKNHSRLVPLYHYVTYLLILGALKGSVVKLIRSYQTGLTGLLVPAVLVMLSAGLMLTAFFARAFALKAQDRAIRAEENLRCFSLTGKLLDSKLTTQQVIALRFAPDTEFIDLARKAVAENLSPRQIKEQIKNWKADYYRV